MGFREDKSGTSQCSLDTADTATNWYPQCGCHPSLWQELAGQNMSWILYLSLTLCLMVQTALGAQHTKEPLVITKYGTLQGKQMHVGKTPINVFLGVPFSRPPVGVRRFAAPEPWEGIKNATTYAPACLQESWGQITSMYFNTRKQYKWLRFSEDCLYLNVYAPVRARGDAPLPVMVWFPGGAFLVGSASTYDGTQLASREKVVLVLLQHRLGILGFLSTGDSQARGNWALLDQVAALRWVQENIAAFGGDPRCVTLFGQSSGAMCISGLMMSPLARGLFHRAISQRGTAALRAFITPDPLRVAKTVARLAGCTYNSTRILVDCLRARSGAEVMHVSKKMGFFHLNSQKDPQEVVWFMSPVVDGVVFPDDPAVLLSQGQVAPVPYLLGVNNLEFSWLLPFIMKISLNQFIMRKGIITKLLWRTSTLLNITKEQLPLVMEEYLGDIDDHDWKMLRNRLMGLAGDAIFVYSTLQAAHHHRVSLFLDAGFPVYLYEFEHHTPTGVIIKPCTDGADHGDEIHFIFGNPFSKGHSTVEEKALSLQMMKYWANFARTGNPNGGKLPYWPRYNEEEKYLQLDFITRVGVKLKEEKMAFWMRLYQH
ncbi:carboxylesterase 4A isoform X3 [Neofelis nebulosa]|uniref:carboxylesterase 4A isoform X3 n=1 Tax=Neofelis nebulosa TaxID=61452 RepID=UPI00272C9F1D|nr:carboxylesterase 4A isoform X3 [Neofelis nebulosa]